MIPTFIRAYQVAVAIDGFLIAAHTSGGGVELATAADDPLIGVTDRQGADAGGMVDIHRGGLVSVRLGATVAAGDPLTANAAGEAIPCVAAAGETRRYIGFADTAGVADDIIDVFMAPGLLHEAAA
jgi:hypothetical protein